jgi:hypothetical protein
MLTLAQPNKLLEGFNAPLGAFSARIAAASALGLLSPIESRAQISCLARMMLILGLCV